MKNPIWGLLLSTLRECFRTEISHMATVALRREASPCKNHQNSFSRLVKLIWNSHKMHGHRGENSTSLHWMGYLLLINANFLQLWRLILWYMATKEFPLSIKNYTIFNIGKLRGDWDKWWGTTIYAYFFLFDNKLLKGRNHAFCIMYVFKAFSTAPYNQQFSILWVIIN